MSYPQFILKTRKGEKECICQSMYFDQQISMGPKLIMYVAEHELLNLKNKKPTLLFTRVGKDEDGGLYERFRENIWYKTENYEFDAKAKLLVNDYKEYKNVWEWLEKRINPLAVMIAALISALVTFAGVNLNTILTGNKQDAKIQELEKQIKNLEQILKGNSKK